MTTPDEGCSRNSQVDSDECSIDEEELDSTVSVSLLTINGLASVSEDAASTVASPSMGTLLTPDDKNSNELLGLGAAVKLKPKEQTPPVRTSSDCVVCFTSPTYYYTEDNEFADLDAIRLGDLNSRVTCQWSTKTGNARLNKDYVESSGEVAFEAGERHARICVPLLDTDEWTHDTHFEVELSGADNEEAGKEVFLVVSRARVWVINKHPYPGGCNEKPTPEFLLHKFFLERCTTRGVKAKVTAYCYMYKAFFDCVIENMCMAFIFGAAFDAKVASLDKSKGSDSNSIFEDDAGQWPDYATDCLSAVAVLVVATKAKEWCDFKQLDLRGRSGTRKDLRNWLVDHYMQVGVKASNLSSVDAGHMINALNNHVEEVVVKGWYQLFILIEMVMGLVFSVFVVMYLTLQQDGSGGITVEWRIVVPIVPSICVALVAAQSREKENVRLVGVREVSEERWISYSNEVLRQSGLIRTFGKEEAVAKQFKGVYEQFYMDHRKHRKFELGTEWRCHWYNGVVYYALLALGPILVIPTGLLSVANFVIITKLYSSIDKYIVGMTQALANMQRASIALESIRGVLNLPTQGHELSKHEPHFAAHQEWNYKEVLGLVAFLFCNTKDPHALPAPEVLVSAADRAKKAALVAEHLVVDEVRLQVHRAASLTVSALHKAGDSVLESFTEHGGSLRRFSSSSSSSSSGSSSGSGGGETKPTGGRQNKVVPIDEDADDCSASAMLEEEGALPPGLGPHSRLLAARNSSANHDHFNPARRATGTSLLHTWVFGESSLTVFDHCQLSDVTLTNRGRAALCHEADNAEVLSHVTIVIPLGRFYVVTGASPQVGKGVGRGVFLEALCGMRTVDAGVIGMPPHLRACMLTSNYSQFMDETVEECILFGLEDPFSVSEGTVAAACRLAGVNERFIEEFHEARGHRGAIKDCPCLKQGKARCRFKVGKSGDCLRVVDRAALALARAFVSDVDVLVVNRAESALNHEGTKAFYDALAQWVESGVEGAEQMCAGVARLRTVILSSHEPTPPLQATWELCLGCGPKQTGLELREISSGSMEFEPRSPGGRIL